MADAPRRIGAIDMVLELPIAPTKAEKEAHRLTRACTVHTAAERPSRGK
jgi:hypothetical protein